MKFKTNRQRKAVMAKMSATRQINGKHSDQSAVKKNRMLQETLHFKNHEAFRKWNAYRNIHGIKHKPGTAYPNVIIAGHERKVRH